eukprot:gene6984-14198_t
MFSMGQMYIIHGYNPPNGAYLHIPFCRRRCYYCDFPVKVIGDRKTTAEIESKLYTDLLLQEIESSAIVGGNSQLDTIYFGGGTPSLMPAKYIHKILDHLNSLIGISENAEITLEMDPGTFDVEQLDLFIKAGITRISLGVQSFDDDILQQCGRAHRFQDIQNAIQCIKNSNINNFSIDLISSLPNLTKSKWKETIEIAASMEPNHISVYDLQVEDGTAFGRWYTPGIFPLPTDEDSAEMYRIASSNLKKFGYDHYEVSNYAKLGYRSKHNQKYWNCESVYGFGMGAASFINGKRFTRPKKMQEYIDYINILSTNFIHKIINSTIETISDSINLFNNSTDDVLEVIMLALRTSDGLELHKIESRFGIEISNKIFKAVGPFVTRELVIIEGNQMEGYRIKLSDPEGFLMSNDVISSIFAEVT